MSAESVGRLPVPWWFGILSIVIVAGTLAAIPTEELYYMAGATPHDLVTRYHWIVLGELFLLAVGGVLLAGIRANRDSSGGGD